ncbi:ABC transporter ATP-binding protein [Ureaplasma diversum]|uniref:ABC transporter ATP-binding protein n=1 Tax=Ureaplasma diversum NCTC 246 TaxID=1188241 RepID=A0A084EZF0_9BACT|nr:ABC transporter ATP-binding protein [Ureaplasma diversum]KEZ23342.1 ABC transporter ATP-binding protein [Ureaplasma diversum NCTC 246]
MNVSNVNEHINEQVTENAIEVSNLSFRYNKNSNLVLDDLNFNIKKQSFTTILGPNGCGKSTTAKSIVKLIKNNKATINIMGHDIKQLSNKKLARLISYIPQNIDVPQGTRVIDFITFGRNPYLGISGILSSEDKAIINKVVEQMQLTELKEKFMHDLSGGQRQKVLLALCMVQDTPIILLDEPTTYLDIKNQYELLESLKQLQLKANKTIIAILHDLNQAIQYSDYLYFLKDGAIFASGTADQLISKQLLKDVYGIEAEIMEDIDPKIVYKIGVKSYL